MQLSTIGRLISDLASEYPDRPALIFPETGDAYTFGEIDRLATNIAGNLWSMGLRKGDRFAVWANNIPEWVLLQFGTAKIGVIQLTVNTGLRGKELEWVLAQSRAKGLAMVPGMRDIDFVEELAAVRAGLEDLEHVLVLPRDTSRLIGEPDRFAPETELHPDECINMQYTSGTTGFPKGVMLSHHNILKNGSDIGERLGLIAADTLCLTVPLFHCFGCVIGVLGAYTHAVPMVVLREFNPLEVLKAVDKHRCTVLYGVPSMFIAELNHPDFDQFDVSSLRTGIMAGSPCPREVMKDVIERMGAREMTIAYGLTEASPGVTMTFTDDTLDRRVGTVGRVLPDVEIRVVDPESGQELAQGQEGELITRGYHVMLGYYDMPDQTERAVRDGWLHTGDLATIDEEGYVRITGRSKDLIIRAGENVSPREIEELLLTHSSIQEGYVYGVPDEFFGQKVAAAIRLKEGARLGFDDVAEFCRAQLAHFKVPEYVDFVESFPTTPSGKIQKYKLTELWIQAHS